MAIEDGNFGAEQPPDMGGTMEAISGDMPHRHHRAASLMGVGAAVVAGAMTYAHFEGTAQAAPATGVEAGQPFTGNGAGHGNGHGSHEWGHPSKSHTASSKPCPPSHTPTTGETSPSSPASTPPSTGKTTPTTPTTPVTSSVHTTPGGGQTTSSSEHTPTASTSTATTVVTTPASHVTPTPGPSTRFAGPGTEQGAKPASYASSLELGGAAGGALLFGLGLVDFKVGKRRVRTHLPQHKL